MTNEKRSFIAGILYIALAIIGPVGFLLLPEQFSDYSVTASSLGLLTVWFFVELLIIGIEIILTIYLWKIFTIHNKQLSTTAFYLRMGMVVIMGINALFLLLLLISGGDNAERYLTLHHDFVYYWQVLFSGHVFLLGYMLFRYVQTYWRYIGMALILGAFGYLLDSIINLFDITNDFVLSISLSLLVFVTIGELGMALVLVLKKVYPETNK